MVVDKREVREGGWRFPYVKYTGWLQQARGVFEKARWAIPGMSLTDWLRFFILSKCHSLALNQQLCARTDLSIYLFF